MLEQQLKAVKQEAILSGNIPTKLVCRCHPNGNMITKFDRKRVIWNYKEDYNPIAFLINRKNLKVRTYRGACYFLLGIERTLKTE